MLRYSKDISSFPYTFIATDKYELKYPERLFLVINIGHTISMLISPLTFVLHSVATLGIVIV